MKLRTFTALLLAAVMLFALTACGSTPTADDSSNDQQQEETTPDTTAESNEFRVGMECVQFTHYIKRPLIPVKRLCFDLRIRGSHIMIKCRTISACQNNTIIIRTFS